MATHRPYYKKTRSNTRQFANNAPLLSNLSINTHLFRAQYKCKYKTLTSKALLTSHWVLE